MAASKEIEIGTKPQIKYNDDGLVPAIVQDAESGTILMMAWMNEAAVHHTLECGNATFYSRSRQKMWVKGESSGHTQKVIELLVDCDQDAIVLRVESHGPACHVGYKTCFYRALSPETKEYVFTEELAFNPDDVYNS